MAQANGQKKSKRIENLKIRKQKILGAGKKLFFSKGYRLTKIEDVAKEAGYSKRTVYLDFKNKDDLFITIACDGLDILLENLNKIPTGKLSIQDYIEQYVKTVTDFSIEQSEYFRMFSVEATQDILENCSPETKGRAAGIEIEGFGLIAREVERAIQEGNLPQNDAWDVAGILVGSVVGNILLSMGGSQVIFRKTGLADRVQQAGWLICQGLLSGQTMDGRKREAG